MCYIAAIIFLLNQLYVYVKAENNREKRERRKERERKIQGEI